MKRWIGIWLTVVLALSAFAAASAKDGYLTGEDYAWYEEIAEYLCADWESGYGELLDALAETYGCSAEEIEEFIGYATTYESDHVWIPVHGGKKYHRHAGCSKMLEPRPSTKNMAAELGFTACGRCNP